MALITTGSELAEAIILDPERVAACLGRIHRFGGQVQQCTVLRHSLSVFEWIDADTDASDAARLWALLHDCHEILTGDVVRMYVNARLRMDQAEIDRAIIDRLPMLVPVPGSEQWERVMAADRAVGDWEMVQIQQGLAPYGFFESSAKWWADLVRGLIERGVT